MKSDKLSHDTIVILEIEGLAPALNEIAVLLIGHGLKKHGHRKWEKLTATELRQKARRHLKKEGRDIESGRLHITHGATRSLMFLKKRL